MTGVGHIARRRWPWLLALLLLALLMVPMLGGLGRLLVVEQPLPQSQVAVILAGPEYTARLAQAASLYNAGKVERVLVNGNRRQPALQWLLEQGYQPDGPWYKWALSVLEFLGVPRDKVLTLSAPEVTDTISEAKAVGEYLLARDFDRITVVTSRYHTRRARLIWESVWAGEIEVGVSGAERDGFDAETWWRNPNFIRAVVAEWGGYLYLLPVLLN